MNIIIMTGSTGGGHNRAAGALKDYITSHDPDARVDILDVIEECSALLGGIVNNGYKAIVTLTPNLFGLLYRTADKPSPLADLMNLVFSQCSKRLLLIMEEKKPDVVISCHAFTAGILAYMKRRMQYQVPLISIVTDFIPHRSYVAQGVDAYITASQEGKEMLTDVYRIPEDRVFFYGHPIYDRFYEQNARPRDEVLTGIGLDPDRLTALVMAGSFGVTDILKIYEKLVNVPVDYQLIVITGKNRRLYSAFEKMLGSESEFETGDETDTFVDMPDDGVVSAVPTQEEAAKEKKPSVFRRTTMNTKPTKLFYYVDNVEDYMHASDLIITKPGGLTTSESIASALPMAVFQAYPGQEEQNADLLEQHGISVRLGKGDAITEQITALLTDPDRLAQMRACCRRYVRKDSCAKIYALAKELASSAGAEPSLSASSES